MRPHILLDLDQTLISAEPAEEYDFEKNKTKAKKFVFHDMDGYYVVFERPGLQNFLTYLFDHFDVSVWTAASKDYALFIVDKIILAGNKNRHLNYIFYSYHCDLSNRDKKSSKNLAMLWDIYGLKDFSAENTLILDDYDEVYNSQPKNCIVAKPFEFNDKNSAKDNFLDKLTKEVRMIVEKTNKGESVQSVVEEINKKLR
jgi:TFIIF-interacting CTD phosphatase-like protein